MPVRKYVFSSGDVSRNTFIVKDSEKDRTAVDIVAMRVQMDTDELNMAYDAAFVFPHIIATLQTDPQEARVLASERRFVASVDLQVRSYLVIPVDIVAMQMESVKQVSFTGDLLVTRQLYLSVQESIPAATFAWTVTVSIYYRYRQIEAVEYVSHLI